MVHQIFLKWAMEKDLLMPYAKDLDTWQYVTSPFAKSSLGVNVEGYVMPMFHSQAELAVRRPVWRAEVVRAVQRCHWSACHPLEPTRHET